jgi:hypothetical protein
MMHRPLFRNLLFVAVMLLLCWVYDYGDILMKRPGSIHQFRQADCLSLADNYYNGNWNLFKPSLNILFSDGNTTGQSAGEFPLLYYFVAILWKLFGKHEFIFRLVTIAVTFAGMFAFFKLAFGLLKNYFWALASVVFLFSSPIFVFYTNNFLVNVPAFSIMLVALSYFYKFWNSGDNRHFFICMAFYLLAGLFKVSSLLSFFAIGAIYLADVSKLIQFKKEGPVFTHPLKQLIGFGAVLAGVVSWYAYAAHYSKVHGGEYTYNGISSYWSTAPAVVKEAIYCIKHFMPYQIYAPSAFIYMALCFLVLLVNFRRVGAVWLLCIPLLMLGYFIFVMLFFYSLNGHDYYHIDFLIIPLLLNLAFLRYMALHETWAFDSLTVKIFFSVFVSYNVLYCANNMKMRYTITKDDQLAYRQFFAPKTDIDLWNYFVWSYPFKACERVTPVLRSMGIQRDDAVLCPEDHSFDIMLYLMDQKGYPALSGWMNDSAGVAARIKDGAKYMMIVDTSLLRQPNLRPFIGYEMKPFENLHIFDLRPYQAVLKNK